MKVMLKRMGLRWVTLSHPEIGEGVFVNIFKIVGVSVESNKLAANEQYPIMNVIIQ